MAALKDPIGANLDRYPDRQGLARQGRQAAGEGLRRRLVAATASPARDGKLPSVGNTVDVANATWTNTIGAPELIAVWKDPDFDPSQRAFYYGRVIEIPTPRWTAYDAKRFGVEAAARHRDDHHGARLHVADLVHAEEVMIKLRKPTGALRRSEVGYDQGPLGKRRVALNNRTGRVRP